MADDGRRVPGWVDHLDGVHRRAGLRAADGLAAEDEDPSPQRGDSRVAHWYPECGDRRERAAVRGGQHRGVRMGSVVAAHDVRGGADGNRRRVGTRRGHRSGSDRGPGTACRPGRVNAWTVGTVADDPPPKTKTACADHGCRRIVQGSVQHADATGPAVGGPQGGNPVRRDAAVRQPAENDQFARRTRDGDLPADRSRQVPGHQAGLSSRQATGRGHRMRR